MPSFGVEASKHGGGSVSQQDIKTEPEIKSHITSPSKHKRSESEIVDGIAQGEVPEAAHTPKDEEIKRKSTSVRTRTPKIAR